jgi:hypothetical protein
MCNLNYHNLVPKFKPRPLYEGFFEVKMQGISNGTVKLTMINAINLNFILPVSLYWITLKYEVLFQVTIKGHCWIKN